jgi:hypothetical protein
MKLKNYQFLNNGHLLLNFANGQSIYIRIDDDSGRVITRPKINSLLNVQHTGIYLGVDVHSGQEIVVHNHYLRSTAYVSTIQEFERGMQSFWKDGTCINDWQTTIFSALNQVKYGRRYMPRTYNCQTFTNIACHNRAFSEDANRIENLVFGTLALLFLGSLALSE